MESTEWKTESITDRPTYGLTWVGARDACASKNQPLRGGKAEHWAITPQTQTVRSWAFTLTIEYWPSNIYYEPFDLKGWAKKSSIRGAKAEQYANRPFLTFHFNYWPPIVYHWILTIFLYLLVFISLRKIFRHFQKRRFCISLMKRFMHFLNEKIYASDPCLVS